MSTIMLNRNEIKEYPNEIPSNHLCDIIERDGLIEPIPIQFDYIEQIWHVHPAYIVRYNAFIMCCDEDNPKVLCCDWDKLSVNDKHIVANS